MSIHLFTFSQSAIHIVLNGSLSILNLGEFSLEHRSNFFQLIDLNLDLPLEMFDLILRLFQLMLFKVWKSIMLNLLCYFINLGLHSFQIIFNPSLTVVLRLSHMSNQFLKWVLDALNLSVYFA